MSKKIRITESQLKILKEQLDSDTGGDDFDSMKQPTSDQMNQDEAVFNTPEELLSSISSRLANAITQKEWILVQDVFNDIRKFEEKNNSQEDLPTIGDDSSVESDTPDEHQERNYGIDESVKKIKLDFKRFL